MDYRIWAIWGGIFFACGAPYKGKSPLFVFNIPQNFRLRRLLQGQIPLLSLNIPQNFRLRRLLQGQIPLLSLSIPIFFRLRRLSSKQFRTV